MATSPVLTREELRPCALCGKGLTHTGLPLVWRVRVERIGLSATAVRQAAGMELLVGDPAIAHALSPVRDFAAVRVLETTLMICEPCALHEKVAFVAMEMDAAAERRIEGANR
jgi:hypothetical protein